MNIEQLSQSLEHMANQAATLDRQRGEHHVPLFDERLFSCRSRLLTPCVKEAKSTLDAIIREQNENKLTALRAEYLTERLVAQIGAIQREISTTKIRKNEIKHSSHFRKPINVLYQELAQHQEWARRLREMVLEKERAVETAPSFMRAEAQKVLLATDQRLARCEAALLKLENQITHREKHQ
ncbi:TPA: prepilin peptidase [Vibrio parahaemolyticus]|uniref:primosomal replication protein n=1 Tax=Vibrio parahaemolyticus TaxID=670 RepID=UPI00064B550A|nr:primosomal replication protein [Vibrio parahaemolyticus]EGR1982411.1 prepilin peptidase [Vibrio parahaemolyticus]EII3439472.1 primosomal replication protein [Vibrio parahaemolyticus]ELA7840131.1 primosomal replication protein [Vibrio parahaemolyticus]OXD28900.1 prepilin peptidase [Vibrio parahaemolyticus]HAS6805386.1 prepilin peptidase [Vibrio parahaemolyticus]